jgi:predicted methyltransferase
MGGTLPPFPYVFIACTGTTLTLHCTSKDLTDTLRVTVNERPLVISVHFFNNVSGFLTFFLLHMVGEIFSV